MALLYARDDQDLLDWKSEGILTGMLENRSLFNTTPKFRDNIPPDLPGRLKELYHPAQFYSRSPEEIDQMHELTLTRQIMNQFLGDSYLAEDKVTAAILDFGANHRLRTRTIELGLSTMLLEYWIEEGLLCRDDKGIVKITRRQRYFSDNSLAEL